ncbi:gliding motility-associated C-terminal domain-containing protein [Flavobacterium sp. SUN052]|uniref:T9SS type B sorting domain-containing protein n=1 Tax=Flavobacterium sp. SUN052 TaxID=3002441 RepID=UPI00237D3BFF|nr:gliding motility-associated C-terminal domain-containing protein [Flavobacterium sp. SUN052]MEC4004320.1 gliding motility-associated C-terminal domain-containing protein [Flavobacterium sp. SUN052]
MYVRAVCSPTDSSAWSTAASITTQVAPPVCGGTFTDPGGATADYANSANVTTTICPINGTDLVTVSFTAFNLENNFDFLKVYSGIGTGGTLLGNYTGATIPPDVSSTAPGTCLTFVFTSDGSVTLPGFIANVTCAPAPTCPKPTTPLTSSVTSNSGTLSWTNNSTATQFEVLALPCTSPPPTATSTGTIITPTTPNTYTFTGLTPDTCYTLYVRAVCSPTDSSTWSTGVNIQTQIAPPVCGGTFTDLGGASANYANGTDNTVTICPTITGQQVTVTFTEFFTEATWDGLYVFDGNSIGAPILASNNPGGNVPGNVPGSYWGQLTGINLPGPFTSSSVDGCLTFRFRSDGSVNDPGWVANVTCAPPPTCPKPTALVTSNITQNSMTVSWTEIGSATSWEVIVQPAGNPPPTASSTGVIVSTNTYTINTLSPGTQYVIYIRSLCSASDISLWSTPKLFTTLIANDECANATVAPVNTSTTCTQTVSGTVIGATASTEPNGCFGTSDDDVWFQFTATSTTHTISFLNITGSTTDLFHVLYSGTCGALTQIYCSDPNSSTANNLVVGQTYYIRVYTYSATANQTSAFDLCIGTPTPPPSCINNTPAGNTCSVATPICNLNGYCGNTSASYTADSWPQLSTAFCGSIENNSFLTFVASSTTISFDVWVTSSQFNNGIQIMVFSAATCGSGPVTSLTCWSTGTVAVGSVNVSASGLTIGNTYYIMIDGFAGDVCSYVIASSSGITAPVLITPATTTTTNTICLGQSATLNASGGNGTYNWSPASNLNSTTGSSVIFSPTAVGTYNITATSTDSNPLCPQSASSTQTITVVDIVAPIFNQIPSFCEGATAPVLPTTSTNNITGSWSPNTVSNTAGITTYTFTPDITQCATPTTMDITVNSGVTPTFLTPAPICSGSPAPVLPTTSTNGVTGSWSPSPVSNTASGTYTFTPDPGQCASSTTLNITVNTNCSFGSFASAVWLTNCSTSDFFNTVGTGTDIIGPATNVFPNSNLGTYVQNSNSLILRGAEVKTFKNASSNVCSARLNYRIYPQSGTPGAFQIMDLPFFDNCGGTSFPSGGPCNTGDQKWQRVVADGTTIPYSPINLTAYPPGNYVLEIYYDLSGSASSTSLCNENVLIDNNGANYIANYTIQSQPNYVSTNPTTCGGSEGTITISGLAPGTNYTLTYNDDSTVVGPTTITSNGSGEITLIGLNSGSYSNFLLQINGCSYAYSTPIVLVDPSTPTVTLNSVTVCEGTPATLTATPGTASSYSYVWTVPSGAVNPGNVASFDATISGTYSVVITNASSGCSSTSASGTVLINPSPIVTVNSPTVCSGTPATVTATPSTPGTYTYTWTVPAGASNPGDVASFDATVAGNYSLIVTNTSTGCSSASITSVVTINPTPSVTVNNPVVCQGDSATVTATTNLTGNYTYSWTVPSGATNPGNVATFNTTVAGSYSVVVALPNNFCNSGFEAPCGVPPGGMSFVNQTNFSCWNTTASDGIIEVWSSGNEGVTSYSGTQFIELNANEVSTLYQNFSAIPGTLINLSFAHRGRFSGTDILEVQVGPVGGPYVSLGQYSAQPSAWVFNTINYTIPSGTNTNYTIRFVSISSGSGNNTVGNFLDDITLVASTCSSNQATGIVTVNPTVTPLFNTIAPICLGESAPVLQTTSNNLVTGSWSPTTIDTSIAGTTPYVFTPDGGQCSAPVTINVVINSVATPTAVVITPTTCATPTGTVQITSPTSGLATVATDLFISELTDSNAGSLSYVELYNGTGATINLANYSIKTASNGSSTYSFTLPLNNVNLASGSTYVIALGNDNYCPSTPGADGSLAAQSNGSGSVNFSSNGNDHIALFNGLTKIDSWGVYQNNNWAPASIGNEGADFRRKNSVVSPNISYSNSDWDALDYSGSGTTNCSNNDYSNIGVYAPATPSSYQYNVDGGTYQSNPIFTGLTPGSHTFTVQDSTTGCISSSVVVVLDPIVYPTVTVNSPTVCAGSPATVTATPGTVGVYTYSWTVPAGATNPGNVDSFTTTTAGTYSVVATNVTTGCSTASTSGVVTLNAIPTVTVNSPTVCAGSSATVIATPGTSATYSYSWTVPAGATNPGDVDTFSTSVAGAYSVIITNTTTGCTSSSTSGVVTINSNPTVSVNSPAVCAGTLATVTATPGIPGTYSYSWTVPAGATNPGNNSSFTTLVGGTYSVVITNTATTCVSTSASGIVTISASPTVAVVGDTVCIGSLATISANPSPSGTYTYAWTVPTGGTNPGDVSTFDTSVAGTYSVVITNASGCSSTSQSGIAAFVPSFDFTISDGCVNNNFILEVIPSASSFDTNTSTFAWELVSSTGTIAVGSNNSTFDVTAYLNSTVVNENLPITFGVTVTYNGCQQYHTIVLTRVYCEIQRGISPNGDGLNEFFDLQTLGVQKLNIFNRYGTKVYSRNDYTNQWFGQADSGNELPDGTYYYVIEFKSNQPSKTGWIYINRETK